MTDRCDVDRIWRPRILSAHRQVSSRIGSMGTQHGQPVFLGLALAFWLVARPFRGIWHDGRLYALQALQQLDPAAFSRDLFFLFGSQDQYSFFSTLYALAISSWGLLHATAVLQALGLGLWFLAALALSRAALPAKPAILALLLIASLGGGYGSHWVFSYGESFLSARLYAEAFGLAGVAAWLSRRRILGATAFAFASLMHPLMTLPALMIGLALLLQARRWFGLIGIGLSLALVLGALGMTPFTGLLHPMDPLWLNAVAARSPFLFITHWKWEGFSRALFVITVAVTAWRILPEGTLRRLAWATLVTVLGAFAIDFVGGSLFKLPLIVGLQLTRVIWIAAVITLVLVVAMLFERRQENVWDKLLLWGLVLAAFLDVRTQGGFALIVVAVCWVGRRCLRGYQPPVWFWALLALVPLQILSWGLLNTNMEAELEVLFDGRSGWRPYFYSPATALLLSGVAYYLFTQQQIPRLVLYAGGASATALLVLAVATWYDHDPVADYDSPARRVAIAPVAAVVPKSATVYWVEAPDKAWFWLGRANYLSFVQTAGSVFSRETALEALRRAPYVRESSPYDANQRWNKRPQAQVGFLSAAAARAACRDLTLDYVIGRSHPGSGSMLFRDPATGWDYGLYECHALRANMATELIQRAVDA